jgi:hypothetical protein
MLSPFLNRSKDFVSLPLQEKRRIGRPIMAKTSITVQLDLETARALHAHAKAPAAKEVRDAAAELGVTLQPVHPGQTHELLAPFFFIDAADAETAERVATRLRRVKGVAGAWVRPIDAAP